MDKVSYFEIAPASRTERQDYNQMPILPLYDSGEKTMAGIATWFVRLEDDYVRCNAGTSPELDREKGPRVYKSFVNCIIKDNGRFARIKEIGEYMAVHLSGYPVEIRYGDVNEDGDIDIAVKMTDGAIHVFHNLQNQYDCAP